MKDQLADFARAQFDELYLHAQEPFRIFDAGCADLGRSFSRSSEIEIFVS